jgi:acetyl-CoA carboxylase carboxyl transferase subunit alpha
MLENAIYSVISPEGCAAILWSDRAKAPEAAEAMKLTAADIAKFGIVDEVLEEPMGGAHWDPEATGAVLRGAVARHLARLETFSERELLDRRLDKYLAMGVVVEE